jgi:hypothetical protein
MPYMGKEYVKGKIGENTKMNLWKWRERVMYNIPYLSLTCLHISK